MIFPQGAQTLRNRGIIEPLDRWRSFSQDCFKPFGPHELDSSGAVLADAGDERKSVSCRNVELARPVVEYHFVVGQESPQEWIDFRVSVLGESERHRDRQRVGVGGDAPRLVVCKG